jgi:hypothetical protein
MKINKLLAGISLGFLAITAGGFAHAQTLLLNETFDTSNGGTSNTNTFGTGTAVGTSSLLGAGALTGPGLLGGTSTSLDLSGNGMGTSGVNSGNSGFSFTPTSALNVQSFTFVIWYDSTSTGADGGAIGNKARLFDSTEGSSDDLGLRGGNVNGQTDYGDITLTGGQSSLGTGANTATYANGTGVWTFVAVTYNQGSSLTSATTDFYTGTTTSGPTLVSSFTGPVLTTGAAGAALVPIFQTSGAFDIGNRSGQDRGFQGYLTDAQLYGDTSDTNGALTSTQITAVYDADLGIGAVPEPSTLALVAAGAIGLLFVAKRRPLGSRS